MLLERLEGSVWNGRPQPPMAGADHLEEGQRQDREFRLISLKNIASY